MSGINRTGAESSGKTCQRALAWIILVVILAGLFGMTLTTQAATLSNKEKKQISTLIQMCDPAYTYKSEFSATSKLNKFTVARTLELYAADSDFYKGKLNGCSLIRPKSKTTNEDEYLLYSKAQVKKILKSLFGSSRNYDYSSIKVKNGKCYTSSVVDEKPYNSKIAGYSVSKNRSVTLKLNVYLIPGDDPEVKGRFLVLLKPAKNTFGYYISSIKRISLKMSHITELS